MTGEKYVANVDLANATDRTCLTIIDSSNGENHVSIDIISESWDYLIKSIKDICAGLGASPVIVEENGVGSAFVESLQEAGVTVYSYLKTKRKR